MVVMFKQKLANGLELSICDHSRTVAADRWHVRVVCSLVMPVRLGASASLESGDKELDRLTRERLGDLLEHRLVRDRNFVDQAVKDEVVSQLAVQLRELVGDYLKDEGCPLRLYAAKYREIADQCALEMARKPKLPDEDNEPADFSHCFR